MRRWTLMVSFAAGLAWTFLGSSAYAQHGHGKMHGKGHGQHKMQHAKAKTEALPNCPVMGDPVVFSISTQTEDGPVYFCCKSCVKKFKADPVKYAEKVAAQRKALAKRPRVQVSCPMTGKPVRLDTVVEHGGKKYYFCCKKCQGRFRSDPAKFLGDRAFKARLAASYTYQTRCPVMGGEVDPEVSTELAGSQRVYFCCKSCVKKFKANPAKYAPKLSAQGIELDPQALKATPAPAGAAGGHTGHGGHHHPQ